MKLKFEKPMSHYPACFYCRTLSVASPPRLSLGGQFRRRMILVARTSTAAQDTRVEQVRIVMNVIPYILCWIADYIASARQASGYGELSARVSVLGLIVWGLSPPAVYSLAAMVYKLIEICS